MLSHNSQEKLEVAITKILIQNVSPKLRPLVLHQILTGGKRLRPLLAITACQALGGKLKDVLYAAAGLEILHNYTLIVDDIIDHSLFRRNQPTTWAKYGKSMAACIAIDYGASVFQTALPSPKPQELSKIFAQTIKKIIDGEITDILFERAGRTDEPYIVKNRFQKITKNDYLKMVSQKTASLFEASCEIGAICAKATKKQIQALKNYGFNLGMAFQIKDDILDIFGQEKKFGKRIGHDIKERKGGNIVLLFACQELKHLTDDVKRLESILEKNGLTQKALQKAIGLIQKTKARKKAEQLGEKYIAKAKLALKTLPQNKYTEALKTLANFVIERST